MYLLLLLLLLNYSILLHNKKYISHFIHRRISKSNFNILPISLHAIKYVFHFHHHFVAPTLHKLSFFHSPSLYKRPPIPFDLIELSHILPMYHRQVILARLADLALVHFVLPIEFVGHLAIELVLIVELLFVVDLVGLHSVVPDFVAVQAIHRN